MFISQKGTKMMWKIRSALLCERSSLVQLVMCQTKEMSAKLCKPPLLELPFMLLMSSVLFNSLFCLYLNCHTCTDQEECDQYLKMLCSTCLTIIWCKVCVIVQKPVCHIACFFFIFFHNKRYFEAKDMCGFSFCSALCPSIQTKVIVNLDRSFNLSSSYTVKIPIVTLH